MHTTPYRRAQQKRIQRAALGCDAFGFFNLLTSDALLETVEAASPQFRERLFTPTETLSLFLAQCMSQDGSCQNAINEFAMARVAGGLMPCSTVTGGYCRARKRLPTEMVKELCTKLSDQMANQLPDQWRWLGHRVRIVDGTTLSMPDTQANQAQWPQQSRQKPGLGFPVMRVVAITCWASGMLTNAAMGAYQGKGNSEHGLLRSIENSLSEGDLLMGDALYGSYYFLASMQRKGVDVLVEQNGQRKVKTDFRTGKRLGTKDHIITVKRPSQRPKWMTLEQFHALPEVIEVRELKSGDKVLITSLVDSKKYSKEAIKTLYKSRWRVELTLRDIKQTLGMDILRCKTPAMVEKEFWVYLLAYNLIRLMMAEAASHHGRDPTSLSFKHCLQLGLTQALKSTDMPPEVLMVVFQLMCQKTVGNRPDRVEPRAIKRRPKPIGFLMVNREEARQHIRKHGHPKRAKF